MYDAMRATINVCISTNLANNYKFPNFPNVAETKVSICEFTFEDCKFVGMSTQLDRQCCVNEPLWVDVEGHAGNLLIA